MIPRIRSATFALCLVGIASVAFGIAPDFIEKLADESRPLEDRMRDDARRPYQVMQLLGVQEGMTVVDIGAGGGWYTRVLSAAVGPGGRVIAHFGPRALQREDGRGPRALAASLGNVRASFDDLDDLEPNVADVAVTALNMHHGNAERLVPYLRAVGDVLKPGGVAAVIDHIGSPENDNSRLHRMLVSDARAWIEEAGLQIVEESDILRTAADDHTLSATDPRIGRNSDRFLFVVRKAE